MRYSSCRSGEEQSTFDPFPHALNCAKGMTSQDAEVIDLPNE